MGGLLLVLLVAQVPGAAPTRTLAVPLRAAPGTVSEDALGQANGVFWQKLSALPTVTAASEAAIPQDAAASVRTGLSQCTTDECMGSLGAQGGFERTAWGWLARTPAGGFHAEARLVDRRGRLAGRAETGCRECDEAGLMALLVDWDLSPLAVAPPGKGSLYVSSRPKGARVSIDGDEVGVTPVRGLSLDAGRHVVDVVKAGHEAVRREVDVDPGREVRVGVRLKGGKRAGRRGGR